MKTFFSIGAAVVFSAVCASAAFAQGAAAAALECPGGVWTPAPVQAAQSGTPTSPAFHAVYGLSCGGNVYMIRFSNKINGNHIGVDILGKTPVGCSGGTWTPTPVQKADAGSPDAPAFHTVYGLSCGGKAYMIRFSNKINGNNISVDILGQTPL